MRGVVLVVAAHFMTVASAFAQCPGGYIGLHAVLAREDAAVVFSGNPEAVIAKGNAQVVTFLAGRAWKGPVTQRMMIYRPLDTNHNARRPFVPGKTYVVVAHRLSEAEKETLGIDSADAFGTDACGGASRPIAASATDFLLIGPGHAPAEMKAGLRGARGEIIVPPERINDVAPVYPAEARAAGIRGVVILEVDVDAAGKVGKIAVVRSIPTFDQAAIDYVRQFELLPALFDDVPSQFRMTVAVSFAPQDH